MALTDGEKTEIVADAFRAKVDSVGSMAQWESFITGISTAQVKSFLQTKLGNLADSHRNTATDLDTLADDVDDLSDDIGAF